MDRTLFSEEHALFRKAFRQFIAREIEPHQARWQAEGMVDRAVWRTAGFEKGKKLAKMGMAAQDTAELAFVDCRVPARNLLGDEGGGLQVLMTMLQQERLCVAIGAQAAAEQVLADTVAYTKEREAFGRPIARFQRAYMDARVQRIYAGTSEIMKLIIAKQMGL